ncbi:ArnT family glycosyltransferase [Dialister hominis]|uniref:ArnT family glycosyltransferase n=1 Tax=Dialister hominis TaxID=2582419 RepID=UPI003AF4A69A
MSTKRQKKEKKEKARQEAFSTSHVTEKSLGFIFILAFAFLLWGSWALPITDPVESNYALTAKEMVMSGNWMSPQIYGIYWYDKPIMVYWLLSISYSILGFTDLAARLPSAFCGALSVTLLTWYVRRILKDNIAAIWAGLMLALSFEFWIISHAIITDSILLLFTIPTLLSAYIGVMEGSRKHLIIAYAAAGFACLTKGPVGLVLPGILLVLWCLSMKEPKKILSLFPITGILAFLVVVLPWYGGMYAIHGSDFVSQFLGLHNIARATVSEHPEDNHWYYYLVIFPAALLPWTGMTIYEAVRQWKEKTPFYRFLMVWMIGTILFYTLMATKYVTYTYISIVPAIILSAMCALLVREGEKASSLCAYGGIFFLIAALVAGTIYIKEGSWLLFYAVILYAVWELILRWKKSSGRRLTVISAVTASAYLFIIMEGLPNYLPSRSIMDSANDIHDAPGIHYFFHSYPAGYTYYTGETGIRLVPSLPDEEKRSALWNEKYVMPSESDEDFAKEYKDSGKSVYLFVSKSDMKYFKEWPMKDDFTKDKDLPRGTLYHLNDEPEAAGETVPLSPAEEN